MDTQITNARSTTAKTTMKNIGNLEDFLKVNPRANYSTVIFFISLKYYNVHLFTLFGALSRFTKKLTFLRSQLSFLLRCRSYDLIPQHIYHACKSLNNISFIGRKILKKREKLMSGVRRKFLNLEISDLNVKISKLNSDIKIVKDDILNITKDRRLLLQFLNYYDDSLNVIKERERN